MSTPPTAMPAVLSVFPPAREHIRAKEIIAATHIFFLENWPFASQKQQDIFLLCNLPLSICRNIPDGEFEKMICACKAFVVLFLTDDWIEKEFQESGVCDLNNRIAQIILGEMVPRAGYTVEELAHSVFREMEASTGVEQYRQFSHRAAEFLGSQETRVYENLSQYLDHRCLNIGGYCLTAAPRYALDIYVTDQELQHPLLAICERLAIDAISMENDVASYDKELQQTTLGNNLVAMLLQHGIDGRGFVSAFAVKVYIRERIVECEARLDSAISEALADSILGTSDTVPRWLHALPYVVSGNTWWSQETARYNLPGKPVPRTVIHLEGIGDTIVPEPLCVLDRDDQVVN
ncbi:isoprenoid synthase domain-containing protein [Mycena capillaripes]|nr:isoprenoid synthase domain-containing protein [Mycena capillaripes]